MREGGVITHKNKKKDPKGPFYLYHLFPVESGELFIYPNRCKRKEGR